jgi:CheY-like chemotaxis protein/tetratricopeptide (TPR) repeat protein
MAVKVEEKGRSPRTPVPLARPRGGGNPAERLQATVLVVEDDTIVGHDLQQTLSGLGYDVVAVAASADEALARAAARQPDVAVVDIRIKGRTDGIKTAQLLQERHGSAIIYLTAHADDVTLERAKQTRPYGYLLKPVNPSELKSAIEIARFRREPAREAAPPAREKEPAVPSRARGVGGARVVRRQIEQIFASPDFDASRRSREFLRFIVEETLAGRGEELTQTAIATRVFGRNENFDAVVDPIVRIQAGRLRRSLERYYLLSGKQDAVRVELPRGTYVPAFHVQDAAPPVPVEPAETPAAEPPAAPAVIADDWPAIVINPFEAGPGAALAEVAIRVTEEVLLELGRHGDVRPLLREAAGRPGLSREHTRFSLEGRVREQDGSVRVIARLVDHASGQQAWGDEYHTESRDGWAGSPEDIARVIAARVGAEEGLVMQLMAADRRRRRAAALTPYGAMLLAYEFFLARDPETLTAALDALRQVVLTEPDCGLAWTRLARLHTANHTFEVTPVRTPLESAITYAQHGVRVDASSRQARCVLASALLIKGELAAARDELEAALRLSNGSLVYLEIIGYLFALLGDDRGRVLIESARRRNPHCLPHASFGLWVDHLRRGDVEAAYQAALEYRDPVFFWRPAMRASCLGLLGRTADAAAEAAELRRRKPDFAARGRVLIEYYLKLPEVRDRVVSGLARAGLTLD